MAPKLSHRFNFSHLNSRQRMSNSGPCPASHVLPPFCGPLRLLLPSPHLRPEFMDGSQPHPDTVGSSLPVFILERDGLSPLTHPGGPTGRPTQVAAPVLTGTPHARVLACMCVCVCVHPHAPGCWCPRECVWGQEVWPSFLDLSPELRNHLWGRERVSGGGGHTGTGHNQVHPQASLIPCLPRFPRRGMMLGDRVRKRQSGWRGAENLRRTFFSFLNSCAGFHPS